MIDVAQNKYLLVIIPPQPVTDFINHYRQQYDQKSFTSIVPHITILPPFYIRVSESELITKLKKVFNNTLSFEISLTTVDYFEGNNKVAFFKPDSPSSEKIKALFKVIQTNISNITTNIWPYYPTNPEKFTPHLTIAEHLPDPDFEQIKQDLQSLSINQEFIVNSIFLLKKINDHWPVNTEIKFQ